MPRITAQEWRPLARFAVASLVTMPFDARLSRQLAVDPVAPGRVGDVARVVAVTGDPGAVLLAGGLLLGGRLTAHSATADLGLHALEALVVSGTLTTALKQAVGRGRPRAVGLDAPFAFTPLRGEAGHVSYPSGHTSAAFAMATVASRELQRTIGARHPRVARGASVAAFALAAGVGAARVVARAHWSSDVVAGAGIGVASGLWTVRFGHARAPTRWECGLLGPPMH